ncbi:hypothetical protein ACFTZI_13610 [Streptomyces decoyicus]|uniref:hypothetical protein n=1 Tax=Streptomyces decoyicus TaxID=249567 RepID=UPI00362FF794
MPQAVLLELLELLLAPLVLLELPALLGPLGPLAAERMASAQSARPTTTEAGHVLGRVLGSC